MISLLLIATCTVIELESNMIINKAYGRVQNLRPFNRY